MAPWSCSQNHIHKRIHSGSSWDQELSFQGRGIGGPSRLREDSTTPERLMKADKRRPISSLESSIPQMLPTRLPYAAAEERK